MPSLAPLGYATGCAPASWAARHTTVCLDYSFKILFLHWLNFDSVTALPQVPLGEEGRAIIISG